MDAQEPVAGTIPESAMSPVEEPGFLEKLKLLFSSPTALFQSLKRKSSWLPPLITLVVVSIAAGLIAYSDIMPSVQEDVLTYMRNTPGIPDQVIQQTEEQFDKFEGLDAKAVGNALIGGVVMRALLFFVVVTVIFLIGTIFFGGVMKYAKVMSMYAWVLPIWALGLIIVTPLMIAKGSHSISLSPALLVAPDPTNSLFFLLSNLSIFNFWTIIVLGIGFSVMYGLSRARGITTMFILWGVWIVLNSFVPYLNFQAWISGLT